MHSGDGCEGIPGVTGGLRWRLLISSTNLANSAERLRLGYITRQTGLVCEQCSLNTYNTFAGLCPEVQKTTEAFSLNSTVSFVDMFALSVGTKVGSWRKFLQNLCSQECQAAHQSSRWNGVRQLRVQTVISELQNFALCSTAYLHKKQISNSRADIYRVLLKGPQRST